MLTRREALQSAGWLDERFFIYSEETDLCYRIKRAGWKVVHLPTMSIIHHANKAGIRPRMTAQEAFARRQYATKHFSSAYSALYLGAVATRYLARAAAAGLDAETAAPRASVWTSGKDGGQARGSSVCVSLARESPRKDPRGLGSLRRLRSGG
jgi:GT2 family glycosyltransferase